MHANLKKKKGHFSYYTKTNDIFMIVIQNHLLCSWEQGGGITASVAGWKQQLRRVMVKFNVCLMLSISSIPIAPHVHSTQIWAANVFITEHISQVFSGGRACLIKSWPLASSPLGSWWHRESACRRLRYPRDSVSVCVCICVCVLWESKSESSGDRLAVQI